MRLRYYPDPILFKSCEEVEIIDEDIHKLVQKMKQIMKENNGLGISANQVGVSKRIFLMRDMVFINPEIVQKDDSKTAFIKEGCLSAPEIYECTYSRSNEIKVKFIDIEGTSKELTATGVEAVCIQHEMDHLNGEFFFDKMPSKNSIRLIKRQWEKQKSKLGIKNES